MVQRKLDFYQGGAHLKQPDTPPATVSSNISFLDLPYSIRHDIYILVGLVRYCPINLNQEGLRARSQTLLKCELMRSDP